jgi:hypothetical protein
MELTEATLDDLRRELRRRWRATQGDVSKMSEGQWTARRRLAKACNELAEIVWMVGNMPAPPADPEGGE